MNTKSFRKVVCNNLFQNLNNISSLDPIVLVVHLKLINLLNDLCTFSQLIDNTQVSKIIICNEDAISSLETLVSFKMVFLMDLRNDLKISTHFESIIRKFSLETIHIIYCTWKYGFSIDMTQHITLQIPDVAMELIPWFMLPLTQLDDNVLQCDLLFNSQNENMYYPNFSSTHKATRHILVDNLTQAMANVIKYNKLTITNSVVLGENSKLLVEKLRDQLNSTEANHEQFVKSSIYGTDHSNLESDLIVFERDIDPLTPLWSQMTYGGILDDIYGIDRNGKLSNITYKELQDYDSDDSIFLDNNNDEIWEELKFVNFGAVGKNLNIWAKQLQEAYDSRHKAETVGEIKQFVDNLGELQKKRIDLKLHTGISTKLLEHVHRNLDFNLLIDLEQDLCSNNLDNKTSCEKILNLLYNDYPKEIVIKLCCILSLTKNGVRDKEFQLLKKEIIDKFGIETMFQFEMLFNYGFFTNKTQFGHLKTNAWKDYHNINTYFELIPQIENDNDPSNPKDLSFAFCGIVPLSIRILEAMFDRSKILKNYSSQQPFVISRTPSLAKMESLFATQFNKLVVSEKVWDSSDGIKTKRIGDARNQTDLSFIVFIGGITIGEIATIKYLQKKLSEKEINKRFIIVTDGVINSKKISNL